MRLALGRAAVSPILLAVSLGFRPAAAQLDPYGQRAPQPMRHSYTDGGVDVDRVGRRLDSEDPKERLDAVEALGRSTQSSKAVTYLLKAINDTDPRVQAKAIDFLGSRRSMEATSALVQKLFMVGGGSALRQRVLTALGRIGDSSASRPILDYLDREKNPDVRGTAIYALGEIGDLTVRDDLTKLEQTEEDPRLKRLVAEALIKIATVRRPKKQEFVPPSSNLVPALPPGS